MSAIPLDGTSGIESSNGMGAVPMWTGPPPPGAVPHGQPQAGVPAAPASPMPVEPNPYGPPSAVAVRYEQGGPLPIGYAGYGPAMGADPPVPLENGHTLGLALLLSGVGSLVGLHYGGLYGGAAGVLYGGATVNAVRAGRNLLAGTPEADHEAAVSGTYAVLCAGLASWILWRTLPQRKLRHAVRNPEPDDEGES
jgi:hypothetical protein